MLFIMMVSAEPWLWRVAEDECSGLYPTTEVPASFVALDPMGDPYAA